MSIILVWVDRQVLDSERFASTTREVFARDDVQQRLAEVIAGKVNETGVIQKRVQGQMPPELAFTAPVINAGIEPLVERVGLTFVSKSPSTSVMGGVVERLHAR